MIRTLSSLQPAFENNEGPEQRACELITASREYRIHAGSRHAPAGLGCGTALYGFAERLEEGESVWLEAACEMDALRSLRFSAGASLRASREGGAEGHVEARFREFRQALSLSFPSVEISEGWASAETLGEAVLPVTLRGVPVIPDELAGTTDRDLFSGSPREPVGARHVVLGACASQASLSDALRLLQSVAHPLSLRVTFTRRQLTSRELRKLAELYRELAALRGPHLFTSAEFSRLAEVSALVAAWLSAKSGIALSVAVHSDAAPSEVLLSAISTAFSLPPSARRDGINPALDLSGCFVRGQKYPDLTLRENLHQLLAPPIPGVLGEVDSMASVRVGFASNSAPVRLDDRSRSRHMVLCGSTGTGKSTLLKNMIASDIRGGHGVVLIDPHGDLFEDVLAILNSDPDIPAWIANTADITAPYSLNLFQSAGDGYRQNFVCNQLIRLLKNSMYKDVPQGFGPMFEAYFRNAFLLLSDGGGGTYTLSDMDRVFGDAFFRKDLLDRCDNEHVRRFWRNIATKAGGEAALENIGPYIVSKLTQFVGNPVISPIVCARESTIDFRDVLASGGVCIVNLAKGKVGATEAEILGGMLTTALFSAALERASLPRAERRPVRVYLDEFQSYAGEVISEMLAECRKYGLEMTLATQSLNRLQVMNGDLTQSVLGNVGSIIALRSGPRDADLLADWIGGGVTREDITSLDDFRAIARFLDNGRVTPPISFRLEEDPGQPIPIWRSKS